MIINTNPTQFPELNVLLKELTERAHEILGDNFVGAYLQGSFAVGDADLASDCDFLIPVNGRLTTDEEAGLRSLHRQIFARDGFWEHHLEGSYPNRDELRTLSASDKEWLYLDHGHAEMIWSTHCNNEFVRWSLRECGVTLVGPEAKGLVDEVGPDILRAKVTAWASVFLPDLFTWTSLDNAWSQRYAVTTFCRILHTLDTGRVTSKKAALLWARESLDGQWSGLISQVLADRAPFSGEPTRPGAAAATLAFAAYARSLVDSHSDRL